ncbi:MAG: hypothetical protein Q7V57_10585 [Actinomycetota bacterium]|nr:hypothetical protein [Actinomycetota bacterium]
MNDELQQRLSRSDPAHDVSIHPVDGPHAAALLEQIMNTPLTPEPSAAGTPGRTPRRWAAFALSGAAVAAIIAVGVVAITGDDDTTTATQVTYSLAAGDPMAMCLRVDEYQPSPGLIGLRGTVAEVGAGTVTLDVTKWYAGGDADQVVLTVADMANVALDGVEFTAGGDYLVTVLDGQVLICGLSAPYSAELEALYDQWFAA